MVYSAFKEEQILEWWFICFHSVLGFPKLKLDIVGERHLVLSGAAMEQVLIYFIPVSNYIKLHHILCQFFHTPISLIFSIYFSCSLGIESFSKLGDSIYFEQEGKDPALYIIQYISSSFNWKSGGILLNQTVVPASSWDPYLYVTFTFSPHEVPITLSYGISLNILIKPNLPLCLFCPRTPSLLWLSFSKY